MNGRVAFWSYVHDDDDDEGGRISALSTLVSRRVRLLSGAEFPIFLDKTGLDWGDDWRDRIDEALLQTSFFIPIISPSYFQHQECRNELSRFARAAEQLGLTELILPIYYVDVPELNSPEPSGEEMIELVRKYQWEDWRSVALEDVDSSPHRKAVDGLARRLIERATTADAKPSGGDVEAAATTASPDDAGTGPSRGDSPAEEQPSEDGDGILEVLAEGEVAFSEFPEWLNRANPIIEHLGTLAEQATHEIQKRDAQGQGFAGRLAAARSLATSLEEPASQLEEVATGFVDNLRKVDPMVTTILRILKDDKDQVEEASEFLDSIETMCVAADQGLGSVEDFVSTLRENARWSKDLRPPSARIEKALRQMADARTLFAEWDKQVKAVRSGV